MSDKKHEHHSENDEEEMEVGDQMQPDEEMEEGEQDFIKAIDMELNGEAFLLLLGKTDEEKLLFRLISKEDETKPFFQNEFSLDDLKTLNENFNAFEQPDEAFIYIIEKLDECEKVLNFQQENEVIILSLGFIEEDEKINIDLVLYPVIAVENEKSNEIGENMEEDEEEAINNLQEANINNDKNKNNENSENKKNENNESNEKKEENENDNEIDSRPVQLKPKEEKVEKENIQENNNNVEEKKDENQNIMIQVKDTKIIENDNDKNIENNKDNINKNNNVLNEDVILSLKNEFNKQINDLLEKFNKQLSSQNDSLIKSQNKFTQDNESKFKNLMKDIDNKFNNFNKKIETLENNYKNQELVLQNYDGNLNEMGNVINEFGNKINKLNKKLTDEVKSINKKINDEIKKNDLVLNKNMDTDKQKFELTKFSKDLNSVKKDLEKKLKDCDSKISGNKQTLDMKIEKNVHSINNKLNDCIVKMNNVDKKLKEINFEKNNPQDMTKLENNFDTMNKLNNLEKKSRSLEDRINLIEIGKQNNELSFNNTIDKKAVILENKLSNLQSQSNDLKYKTESVITKTNYLQNLINELDNKTKLLEQQINNKLNKQKNNNECGSVRINSRKRFTDYENKNKYNNSESDIKLQKTNVLKEFTPFNPNLLTENNINSYNNNSSRLINQTYLNNSHLVKCGKITNSKIFNYKQMEFLEERLKKIELPKNIINFNLVYRASENGDKASDFHNKCDNIGPNITFIKTMNGYIFGGFTCKNWEHLKRDIKYNKPNLGSASRDPRAFCFCFNNKKIYNNERPNEFAIWCNKNYGPTFKNNFFQVFDECLTKGGYCSVRSNSHFGGQDIDYEIIGGNDARFNIQELEVYEVMFQ